ncbi:uncharacterized protein LOC119096032 [Pollicipes pollicipes]|uniref:uncharacterized protein LOC119096032 n=1 Tax=Pollicipes pollicipes TaxID=41117 RepID=UPI001884B04E|nr:uncharacterized protein LOC119096032 [Pollicipes pollicipes]XP_037074798.1 uncharacterized protein LOC119096032 [Pollicipes pollicipes]
MAAASRLLRPLLLAGLVLSATACNKDNKEVAHCLHTYLERDFISIEAIVYPRTDGERRGLSNINRGNRRRPGGGGSNFGDRPILDGPEMAENCKRIEWMISCFEGVLVTCDSYSDFFRYRDLLRSVSLVKDWLCDDVIQRFSVLVSSVSCYKEALLEAKECEDSSLTENLWPQVLRMEKQQDEICTPLRRQSRCLERSGQLEQCEEHAAELYHNVTGMFLNSWCGAAAAPAPGLTLPLLSLLVWGWARLAGFL